MHLKKKVSPKRFLTATLALTILFLFVSNVYAHTVAVPTTAYFGFGNNCYIKFASTQSFGTVYRENSYWYFGVYGFQIQNGNMTINTYFVNGELELKVTPETGKTSTTKVYVADKGQPTIATGADSCSYNDTTKIVTITNSGGAIVTLAWNPSAYNPPPSGGPPPAPPPPPPATPPPILEAPKYVINFEYLGIFLFAVGSILLISMVAKARKPKTLQGMWRQKVSIPRKSSVSPWLPIVAYVLFILLWFLVLRRLFYG